MLPRPPAHPVSPARPRVAPSLPLLPYCRLTAPFTAPSHPGPNPNPHQVSLDADKVNHAEYVNSTLRLLRPGGMLVMFGMLLFPTVEDQQVSGYWLAVRSCIQS